MPSVEIVAVGTEMLLGQLVDTNTPFIAGKLAENGVDVFATHAVGDNRQRIAATIRAALERADGVITTGGLGPTVDDLTKEAVCDAIGVDAEVHEPSLRAMEEVFAKSGRRMRENNRKQALIPRGSVALPNREGTAPGFVATTAQGKFVASMPGVPREMKPMLTEGVVPWLQQRFRLTEHIRTRTLHTIGLAESEIDHRIADLFATLENPKIAVLAHQFRCDVKIMAKAASADAAIALIAPVEHELLRRLDGHVYGVDDETLPFAIHVLLLQTRRTIAVAESCTGGSIAAALTSVPGSSKIFAGGVVSYSNGAKMQLLGVEREDLKRHGAVSEEVAKQMAAGVRRNLGTSLGLAITGIAGPSGGTHEKPVGLVWLAISEASGARTRRLQLAGDREGIQSRATTAALGFLWETAGSEEPIEP
ncbi:MAG TPA: competence/damage-inducible protein A [Candidatus Rubrimentiphilum sp.]|nr:competence/damage-inducible protein A [Candidatus Rubrimentiphilum sp.]